MPVTDPATGRPVARYLGALVASAALLAGCALVDDARREFEPEEASTPRPAGTAPPRSPSPSSSPSAPSAPTVGDAAGGCPPSGTLVRAGTGDAAMGLRAMSIELVNCGPVPVTLNGYPDLRILDEDRAPLPVAVIQGSSAVALIDGFDTPPAPVTAMPGERLAAGLVWRNTVDTVSDPVNGTYLEVVPAPGQPPQIVRPDGRIDVGTTGRVGITAWRLRR